MQITLPLPDHSLIRFAQFVAEVLANGLWGRLSLGRFGHVALLPRAEHAAIAAELSLIEAITRRALFLIAALRGALAPAAKRAAPLPPVQNAQSAAPSAGPARSALPRFRLIETARAASRMRRPHTLPLHPAQIEWASAPHPGRAPLLPAARLVRRLRALETVFLDPEAYVLRMRRLIGVRPQEILVRSAFVIAPHRGVDPMNHRILGKIQGISENALIQLRLEPG